MPDLPLTQKQAEKAVAAAEVHQQDRDDISVFTVEFPDLAMSYDVEADDEQAARDQAVALLTAAPPTSTTPATVADQIEEATTLDEVKQALADWLRGQA